MGEGSGTSFDDNRPMGVSMFWSMLIFTVGLWVFFKYFWDQKLVTNLCGEKVASMLFSEAEVSEKVTMNDLM